MSIRENVEHAIISIAKEPYTSRQAFESKVKELATELGIEAIEIIPRYFHQPPQKPEVLQDAYTGLGEWLSVCQFIAFELLFNFGKDALPIVKEVAFGPYDWTQGNAIELLIRFATIDIEKEQIIRELNEHLPTIRYEAIHYAIEPLFVQIKSNPAISETLQLIKDETFQDILGSLQK